MKKSSEQEINVVISDVISRVYDSLFIHAQGIAVLLVVFAVDVE